MEENITEEPRRTEVVQEFTLDNEVVDDEKNVSILEGVDLNDAKAIADYYLVKNNIVDSDQLEVEKKEKEIYDQIKEVVENKESLVEYLTNLHASIEVMEERIYELELQIEKREKQSVIPTRPNIPGLSGKGLSQLPFSII